MWIRMNVCYKDIHGCANCGHSFVDTENEFVWYCERCSRIMGFNIIKERPVSIEMLPEEILTIALVEEDANSMRG